MLRKVYLSKCLTENNWEAVKEDLNKRPVEGVSGNDSQESMEKILQKYGISKGKVEIWGTGKPMREFLWSEEMADACVYVMEHVDFKDLVKPGGKEVRNTHINIGTGKEISIKDLAHLVAKKVNFAGELYFNADKPDGTMRKLIQVDKIHRLGWKHKIGIEDGIEKLYNWYLHS